MGASPCLARRSNPWRVISRRYRERKIGKPVLVGHSLGGTLSLAFAAEHSELIAGVVAVDGLPVFPGTERHDGRPQSRSAQRMRAQIDGPDSRAVRDSASRPT